MLCPRLTRLSFVVVLWSWLARGRAADCRGGETVQISKSCLRNWLAQAEADERGGQTRLTTTEKQELV